jgi:hypothetical protein
MGNTTSRTETIEKSDREAQIANIMNASGGYSEAMSEIDVQIVDLVGGKPCGQKDDEYTYNLIGGGNEFSEIDVRLVDLHGGSYHGGSYHGGSYQTDNFSEIDVKLIDLKGGAGAYEDADHASIYKEIRNRISDYQQKGGSANNEFFDMLERKLNGIESESRGGARIESDSPFLSSSKNKFIKTLQAGGYRHDADTETATVTAKKLLNTIVQMGGEDSDSSSDSDFSSTEGSSGEESSSDSDFKSPKNSDTFAMIPVKAQPARMKKKKAVDSDVDSDEGPISDDELFLSSSSLETDDINLISYSPR